MTSNKINSISGMTLIEVLVAGVIGTIVAGTMLILWKSNNDSMLDATAGTMLQSTYLEMADHLARQVRAAHRVFGDSVTNYNDSCRTATTSVDSLYFYNRTSAAPFAAIKIIDSILYDCSIDSTTGQLNCTPFTNGTGTGGVKIGDYSLVLSGCRNQLWATLTLRQTIHGETSVFSPGTEVLRCRD